MQRAKSCQPAQKEAARGRCDGLRGSASRHALKNLQVITYTKKLSSAVCACVLVHATCHASILEHVQAMPPCSNDPAMPGLCHDRRHRTAPSRTGPPCCVARRALAGGRAARASCVVDPAVPAALAAPGCASWTRSAMLCRRSVLRRDQPSIDGGAPAATDQYR